MRAVIPKYFIKVNCCQSSQSLASALLLLSCQLERLLAGSAEQGAIAHPRLTGLSEPAGHGQKTTAPEASGLYIYIYLYTCFVIKSSVFLLITVQLLIYVSRQKYQSTELSFASSHFHHRGTRTGHFLSAIQSNGA